MSRPNQFERIVLVCVVLLTSVACGDAPNGGGLSGSSDVVWDSQGQALQGSLAGIAQSDAASASVSANGVAPEVVWIRQFGPGIEDNARGVSVEPNGNVLVAGYTDGALPGQSSAGEHDAFVRKYDTAGNELWTRQFGSGGADFASGVSVDANGNVLVVGSTLGALPGHSNAGVYDVFVRKYDTSGNELWTRQFGTSTYDDATGVSVDPNGDVLVAGYTYGELPTTSSAGGYDAFVRKYDTAGNELWTGQFGSIIDDFGEGVSVDANGNVLVAGYTTGELRGQSSAGENDAFVRKYGTAGNVLWTRQFGTSGDDGANGVSVDANGNVLVAGVTRALPGPSGPGDLDAFVRKYDTAGNEAWARQFGTSSYEIANGVSVDANGNVLVAGYTDGALSGQSNAGESDAFVRKYDTVGDELWTRQFGTRRKEYLYGVSVDTEDNVLVAGFTHGTLPGQSSASGRDAFVLKLEVPSSRKVAVLFQGLNTTLSCLPDGTCTPGGLPDNALALVQQDLVSLRGFREEDVLWYSYKGGALDTSLPSGWRPNSYECPDTNSGYGEDIEHLLELLSQYSEAFPGTEFYLVGHSQGGLVAMQALGYLNNELANARVAAVFTLGSPLGGSPRANTNWAKRFTCWDNPAARQQQRIWETAPDHGAQGDSATPPCAFGFGLGAPPCVDSSNVPYASNAQMVAARGDTKLFTWGNLLDPIYDPTLCSVIRSGEPNLSTQVLSGADIGSGLDEYNVAAGGGTVDSCNFIPMHSAVVEAKRAVVGELIGNQY
jgi:pimeloyl-ACP methyl ester carboxylesterase